MLRYFVDTEFFMDFAQARRINAELSLFFARVDVGSLHRP
jgi:hypothetical protein